LDIARNSLRHANREIELRPKSFEVLCYLVENPERLVTREELIRSVWRDVIVTEESLTHCVSELRQAMGDTEQAIIKTVPRRGYRFVAPVSCTPMRLPSGPHAGPHLPTSDTVQRLEQTLPDRASVAVLAFVNLSGDPRQEYFSDGITEDIITELSRFSELTVIARNSTFQYKGRSIDIRQIGQELGVRYVLEGSVRRDGERVRITAQLIDALTGAHRWAERYDRELSNVFAVQDEVTHAIVTILAAHVNKAETERALQKPAATWEAYEYYLRGIEAYRSHLVEPTKTQISEVRCLFEQSLSIDPRYARAYAMLARTRVRTFWDPIDDDFLDTAGIDSAYELARKAVQFDENLPLAHFQLALAFLFRRQREQAIAELERAFALNPNYTDWQFGFGLVLAGQSTKAIEVLQANMRLDPFGFPPRHLYMGQANYMLERYVQAVAALRECASRLPDLWTVHIFLAATYAKLGRVHEAKSSLAELLRTNPKATIQAITRALPYNDPKDVEHLRLGLRKAGLRES